METSTIILLICALTLYKVMQIGKPKKEETENSGKDTDELKETIAELGGIIKDLGLGKKK